MKHMSLFAGAGMTDIATEASGFETVATAEIDAWNRELLAKRFPTAVRYTNVHYVDAAFRGVDLISGGFPCQDISLTGHARGLSGTRSGLWREFARIVLICQPRYVLVENVAVLRSRGGPDVVTDLCSLGYDVRWDCIPAAAVGAPHMRDRIWIMAVRRDGPSPWTCDKLPDKLPRAGQVIAGNFSERGAIASHKDVKAALRRGHALLSASPAPAPVPGLRSGLWPSPRRHPNEWRTTRNAPSHDRSHGATLAGAVNDAERHAGRTPAPSSESAGNLSPTWVEWLMGLPQGWTNSELSNDELQPFAGWHKEPLPRTEANALDRRARLSALGNGLVPQAAALALQMMFDLEKEAA
jgi:site-specific DNA-cytosine methylase